jgi:RNA polymerase sigma factor (sigma-70 family)
MKNAASLTSRPPLPMPPATIHPELLSAYEELVSYLRQRLGNRDRAEELAQESMSRVLALPPEHVQSPRAFLFRTARNLHIDQIRASQTRRAVHDDEADPETAEAPVEHEPAHRLEQSRRQQSLQAAIAALPPRCREVFILHKLEGLPQKDVARQLGISLNMVEKHVMRGLLACREALRMEDLP